MSGVAQFEEYAYNATYNARVLGLIPTGDWYEKVCTHWIRASELGELIE